MGSSYRLPQSVFMMEIARTEAELIQSGKSYIGKGRPMPFSLYKVTNTDFCSSFLSFRLGSLFAFIEQFDCNKQHLLAQMLYCSGYNVIVITLF
jgi:hypothetical protein